MSDDKEDGAYWKANITIIRISLVIWALVSFGFGILLLMLIRRDEKTGRPA